MATTSSVYGRARSLGQEIVAFRQDIHRHPELGFQERRTAALAADHLRSLGLEVITGVAKTGIIGILGSGSPVVMLRADMDALQVQEENDVPYASQNAGLMHACGHDAHVACLLGAARILAENPPPGQIRFLFQPSEEGADEEGKHGGRRVMEEGFVEDLDAVFGLHVSPELPCGAISAREGVVSSAADRFRGAVLGRACHGARPEDGLDAIALTASVINAIHHIVSRRVAPRDSGVVTIGTIHGGTRHNIIPGRVDLTGTMRSYSPTTREALIAELERAFSLATALGGGYELNIDRGPASVINDPALSEMVREAGREMLGAENVVEGEPMMGSEDFSFLTRHAPGCFFRLGVGFGDGNKRVAHSSTFDINEEALPVGAAMLAAVAHQFCERYGRME